MADSSSGKQPTSQDAFDPVSYRMAYDTRNFEISLFWQRSNYFLVLNTAIAAGLIGLKEPKYQLLLCAFGLSVSLLWLLVNAGSKFWQSRWERRLARIEIQLDLRHRLFSEDWETIRADVDYSLRATRHGAIAKMFDALVRRKPSVSLAMAFLAAAFCGFWFVALMIELRA